MGVPSVREFALPIIIGLIAGAYSSIFVTGSLWYVFKTKLGKNRVIDKPELIAETAGAAAAADTGAAVSSEAAAQSKAVKAKAKEEHVSSVVKPPKKKRKRRQ